MLVSAGFDAADGDPLGSMRISPSGYAQMTRRLLSLAGGRVVLALEGGYDLEAIARSAAASLRVLLGEPAPEARLPDPVAARDADPGPATQGSRTSVLTGPSPIRKLLPSRHSGSRSR